jgi:hypothetical protein
MKLPPRILERLWTELSYVPRIRKPDFVIGTPDSDYLRRWYIIPRNVIFNIYLHQILRSDDDRALHDHPWWNVSIILSGSYVEHTICAGGVNHRREYTAGSIKLRSARYAHRIELIEWPAWSLFITGPRMREWGFHCPRGWRHWKEFTSTHNTGQIGKGCE